MVRAWFVDAKYSQTQQTTIEETLRRLGCELRTKSVVDWLTIPSNTRTFFAKRTAYLWLLNLYRTANMPSQAVSAAMTFFAFNPSYRARSPDERRVR
jgi:hypothetical protein